jgi:hypothetical protein
MSFNPITEPIDTVDFAGQKTPGLAEIRGAGTPRRWDEAESVGFSGAFLTYHGQKLSHFSVVLRLMTTADFAAWDAFYPLVKKVPLGKRQKPLDITHPITANLGISSVVVEDVLQPEQVEDGIWQVEIQLIEYRSPRLALAAAQGSQADPADPEDAIIEENRRQIDALGQELGAA